MIAAFIAAAIPAFAEISAVQGYVRDGEIGLSVRNELDAAQARSRRWLVATQLESGAWDSTNQCGATALAALALSDVTNAGGQEAIAFSNASRRAVSWLKEMPEEQLSKAGAEELAWRDLAIAMADSPDEQQKCFAEAMRMIAGMASENADADMVRDCANEIADGSEESRAALAAKLAAAWRDDGMPSDPQWGASRTRFMLACFIGSCADGILSAEIDGRLARVPWREDVAGALVSRQRVDPRHSGTAFWRGSATDRERDWAAEAVPETAFALLCIGLL